jgi:colanic acid/amylovoran biosynthesis protein
VERGEKIGSLLKILWNRSEYASVWLQHRHASFTYASIPKHFDAILDVSGFAYSDKWGIGRSSKLLSLVEAAQRVEIPYILMPQAWGPFCDELNARLVADAVQQTELCYARDRVSLDRLNDLVGEKRNVLLCPDITLLFEPYAADRFEAVANQNEIDMEKGEFVAVAPNMRVYERMKADNGCNKYVDILCNVVRKVTNNEKEVLLIPHEVNEGSGKPYTDDRKICIEVTDRVENGQMISWIDAELRARDLKALIGGSEILIGSRFHSLVAALSQEVPSIAIGWAQKYPELMRDFGQEEFSYKYEEISGSKVLESYVKIQKNYEKVKKNIKENNSKNKRMVEKCINKVTNILNNT